MHELILAMPAGYDTVLGPNGTILSGGQRQRIGLARAFFGNPKFMVLDEPNANLDAEGDMALDRAMGEAKRAGATVVIVTQRKAVAERADALMIIKDGAIEDYGPTAKVVENQNQKMAEMQRRMTQQRQALPGTSATIMVKDPNVPAPGGKQ